MKVAVTGGTGFVGGKLVQALLERGDEVWIISRTDAKDKQQDAPHSLKRITWAALADNPLQLKGAGAIVNLAGESINQRWSEAAKLRILNSRIEAAERIAGLAAALGQPPEVVVNASGISIYGTSERETFVEDSPHNITDFLASVTERWEAAADRIPVSRLVKVRVGVVLGTEGGALPPMTLPYKMFVGGKVGSGRQWLSWIHLEDMVRLLLFCIDNPEINGPVNAVAPAPVTNDQFGRALSAAMKRPHWFPVPSFMMKTLFGELSVLLLEGQRVLPHKAVSQGFEFTYPTIESAMKELIR